jgi:hypothetical protein
MLKRILVLMFFCAPLAHAQFYSAAFGGEMGVGYVANPAAGTYPVFATPSVAQSFPGLAVCEVHNVAAVVPLQPQTYQPVGGTTASLTSPSFSFTGGSIVLMAATTSAGGFNASVGSIGGTTATLVSSTNGQNINVEYATFGSSQSSITAAIGGLGGASIAIPVALLASGGTPVVDSCAASPQGSGTPASFQITMTVLGGSGHALIAWSRNGAGSQIPIVFSDSSSANGGQGNQWLTLSPAFFYISQAAGSDSNNGLTTATAWQHDPEMQSHPTHTATAGDVYIFKGCDDWPNASFPLISAHSGTSAAAIFRTVDQSWYNTSACPSAWNRPKWDAGAAVITGGATECTQTNNIFNNAFTILSNHAFLTFQWIEETGYKWNGCGTNTYEDMNGAQGTEDNIHFSNMYMHNFTATFTSAGSMQAFSANSTPWTNSTNDHLVEDDSDTSPSNPNGGNIDIPTTNSYVSWVDNAFRITTPGVYANNNISHVDHGPSANHPNTFESLLSGTVYIFNNYIHDMTAVDTVIATGNPGETDYIWNNVIANVNTTPMGIPQGSSSVSIYIWNNTMETPSNGTCILLGGASDWTTAFVAQNNFCLGSVQLSPTPTGTPTITITNNVLESTSSANSQGYARSNTPPWSPTSTNCNGIPTNCPVGAGTNLITSATSLIASLGLDTTAGCSEQTINTVIQSVCYTRNSVQRPGIGVTLQAWDTGAYQLPPALTVNVSSVRPGWDGSGHISKDIYGFLGAGQALDPTYAASINIPLVRAGGDPWSRYNGASDSYCFVSYQTIWQCGQQFGNGTAYNAVDSMISTYRTAFSGVHILATIPTIPYISYQSLTPKCSFPVSTYGTQTSEATVSGTNCGNGINGSGNITDTNPTYNMVVNTTTIAGALASNVLSNAGAGQFYQLDNEPGSWSATHRDAIPCAIDYTNTTPCSGVSTLSSLLTYDEAMSDEIYSVDPTAKTIAPSDFGPYGIFNNCSSCTGGANPSYSFQMFLKQYSSHDTSAGHRTLYALDEHWQVGNWDGVIADDFNWNRTFWDSNYLETTFGGIPVNPVQLIPTLLSGVTTYYPGTYVSFSELECSGYSGIQGVDAAVFADGLGIFGYYGVRMAALYNSGCAFNPPPPGVEAAYNTFLNYNGSGGLFGDVSVTATTTDATTLSVYPAKRTADNHLTILVVNKSPNPITSALAVSGYTPSSSVPTYTSSNFTNGIATSSTTAAAVASGYAYPGYSTTLLDMAPSGSQASAPSCSPTSGAVPQTVTCTNPNSGTTVMCYNFTGSPATNGDGATCPGGSTPYTGAISVSSPSTLYVVAGTSTLSDSSVVDYTYTASSIRPASPNPLMVKSITEELQHEKNILSDDLFGVPAITDIRAGR